MSYKSGQQRMISISHPINIKFCISLHPNPNLRDPPIFRIVTHSIQLKNQQKFLWLWLAHLLHETHQCTKDPAQESPQSRLSGCNISTTDAELDHCSLRAWLWFHCVWHSIKYQPTTSEHHVKRWNKIASWNILTQPSYQYVHGGKWTALEERRLKLSMHYHLKIHACTDIQAHPDQHEVDPIKRNLCLHKPNWRGGMSQHPSPPFGLKVVEAMTSTEINVELAYPLRALSFPYGTHKYDPKRHSLIERVIKCMITSSGQIRQVSRCPRTTWWSLHWWI